MKYDFRVGDYVEEATGRVGYIQSICQCEQCKARGFYEPFVLYTDGNGDYITAYEYEKGFPGYKRIGQYDFTDCAVGDIEPLMIEKPVSMYCGDGKTNSPSDYRRVALQDEFNDKVMKKINELVVAVNELRMRDAKESKDD
jgi:hypothetical protein